MLGNKKMNKYQNEATILFKHETTVEISQHKSGQQMKQNLNIFLHTLTILFSQHGLPYFAQLILGGLHVWLAVELFYLKQLSNGDSVMQV